jgi:hypothetical protein
MSETTGPDRLFIALLEEWNERHPGGEALSPELQEIISRHITWARTMSAEAMVNLISRKIELTPSTGGYIPVHGLLEYIRTLDPADPGTINIPIKRDYRFKDDHICKQTRSGNRDKKKEEPKNQLI